MKDMRECVYEVSSGSTQAETVTGPSIPTLYVQFLYLKSWNEVHLEVVVGYKCIHDHEYLPENEY